jgi:tetratricopeptide (TPR) repeat protein
MSIGERVSLDDMRHLLRGRDRQRKVAAEIVDALISTADEVEFRVRLQTYPVESINTIEFVEKVSEAARSLRLSKPAMSLYLTTIATSVADSLPEDAAPGVLLHAARGRAWSEHAHSVTDAGTPIDALLAVERARGEYTRYGSSVFELARVELIRARILYQLRRGIEAIFDVRRAITIFQEFEDAEQVANGRMLEAAILYQSGRYAETVKVWQQVLDELGEEEKNSEMAAALFNNLAACFRELRKFAAASAYMQLARELYEEAGQPVNVARVDWNIAKLHLAAGAIDRGAAELREVAAMFSELGMPYESAMVHLDLVEVLVAAGDHSDAIELGRSLVRKFSDAGVLLSASAALAYLEEALRGRSAKPSSIKHVISFFEALRSGSPAVFVPPK